MGKAIRDSMSRIKERQKRQLSILPKVTKKSQRQRLTMVLMVKRLMMGGNLKLKWKKEGVGFPVLGTNSA